MNTLLSFGIHYFWKKIAVKTLDLKKSDVVLDLCGGTGDLSVMASKRIGLSGKVLLYDINRSMIKKGISRIVYSSARPNIFHIQGDAELLSFPDDIFDAVIVGFGIRNLTHPEKGFREMHRVLKPGGKMVCLEFSQPTMPLFRCLYDFYSFRIIPLLGSLIVGSGSAYCYLTESIRMFPLPEELAETLRLAGFRNIKYRRLTNGIAVVHRAIKAPPFKSSFEIIFLEHYESLGMKEQRSVEKAVRLVCQNPRHPSLNVHKVKNVSAKYPEGGQGVYIAYAGKSLMITFEYGPQPGMISFRNCGFHDICESRP